MLWEAKLEASAHSSPITYMGRDGRQYVTVMAAGGGGVSGRCGEQYAGGVRAAGCSAQAIAGIGDEGRGGRGGVQEGAPNGGSVRAGRAARGWSEGAGGEDLRCGCHSIEVVTSQRMTEAHWKTIVEAMVARGAQASDAETKVIVEYLAKTLGK